MNRTKLVLLFVVLIMLAVLALIFKPNYIFSQIRTDVRDNDAAKFERLSGFAPYAVLFVEEWPAGGMGSPGQVTYGAIVADFSEQGLQQNGWNKIEKISSVNIGIGNKFKTLAYFNHNLFVRNIKDHQVVLMCSPYGDDNSLGQIAYLVFVCAEYNTVFD